MAKRKRYVRGTCDRCKEQMLGPYEKERRWYIKGTEIRRTKPSHRDLAPKYFYFRMCCACGYEQPNSAEDYKSSLKDKKRPCELEDQSGIQYIDSIYC